MAARTEDDVRDDVKVLVVEDETLVGMDLVIMLEEWGYAAEGPLKSVSRALNVLQKSVPDVAILDINLGNGETSFPIAAKLSEMNVPFLFLTGYDQSRFHASEEWLDAPHLRKPLEEPALRDVLSKIAPKPRER